MRTNHPFYQHQLVAAPVLATPAIINDTDTAFIDTFAIKTGILVASVDFGLTKTYSIAGTLRVDVTDNLNGTVSKTNAYDTLTVNKTTDAYSFAPIAPRLNHWELIPQTYADSDSLQWHVD